MCFLRNTTSCRYIIDHQPSSSTHIWSAPCLSTHLVNTSYYYALNTPCHYILLRHPINAPYQHILIRYPVTTPYYCPLPLSLQPYNAPCHCHYTLLMPLATVTLTTFDHRSDHCTTGVEGQGQVVGLLLRLRGTLQVTPALPTHSITHPHYPLCHTPSETLS